MGGAAPMVAQARLVTGSTGRDGIAVPRRRGAIASRPRGGAVTKPTRADTAGRRYLDLQKLAKETGRRTDELFQLYALEGFLDRVSRSDLADRLILKGGV